MLRVEDPDLAWRVFSALERQQAVLYLQRFVKHPGWDLRVFTLGDRVLAGMRRSREIQNIKPGTAEEIGIEK